MPAGTQFAVSRFTTLSRASENFTLLFSWGISEFWPITREECVNLAVDYISNGKPDLQLTKTGLRNLF